MGNYNDFPLEDNVKRFDTEADAEDFMEQVFLQHGFEVKRQVNIGRGARIDLVARKFIDDRKLLIPVEVKSWFRGASDLAKATFQASHYASMTNHPFFLGPIVNAPDAYSVRVKDCLSFMCRLNVGVVMVSDNKDCDTPDIVVFSENGMPLYRRHWREWDTTMQERVIWDKLGMRSQDRSKNIFTKIVEGEQ